MTVIRKTKQAPVTTVAATPEVIPSVVPEAKPVYARLVNGCSTYVTPEREVFYARDPQTKRPRVYEVSGTVLDRLLTYRDDYGRKFFRQVERPTAEEAPKVEVAQVVKISDKGRPGMDMPASIRKWQDDETLNNNDGEIDTGAVRSREDAAEDAGGVDV